MRAYQIFQNVSEETGRNIIEFLREEDRESYRATLSSLAAQRRLRPIFIQRKTREAQAAWMLKTLQLKQCDLACEQLLQTWLLKGYQDLLVAFLDGVGIGHNGKGEVEELPDEIDGKKLKETTEKLLEEYEDEMVGVYYRVFNLQKLDGWQALTDVIKSEPRLRLAKEEPPAEEPAEAAQESKSETETKAETEAEAEAAKEPEEGTAGEEEPATAKKAAKKKQAAKKAASKKKAATKKTSDSAEADGEQ